MKFTHGVCRGGRKRVKQMKLQGIYDKGIRPSFSHESFRVKSALKASALAGGLALVSLPARALPSFYVQSNL
jgi:hypothetical protein